MLMDSSFSSPLKRQTKSKAHAQPNAESHERIAPHKVVRAVPGGFRHVRKLLGALPGGFPSLLGRGRDRGSKILRAFLHGFHDAAGAARGSALSFALGRLPP